MKKILLSMAAIASVSMASSDVAVPVENAHKNSGTVIKSKAAVLKFSGTHYLGFVSDDGQNEFETRRNYLQVKAYFNENPKDYMRVTLDTFHNASDDGKDSGSWEVRLKYAYLYLDNVLPFTGVEMGQAHRPWIDYEEHHGWNYRSISKVYVEAHDGAHFTNSADIGVNFKTKTANFSSELGLFNGEGYHGVEDGNGLSAEWRLTGHLLGTGKKHVHKSDTYADISFFGQYNTDYKEKGNDFVWYGVHAVYNQAAFLLSAQYVKASEGGESKEGNGFSVNTEVRVAKNWNVIARYDNFTMDATDEEKERTLAGLSYKYNKNVEFIANYLTEEVDGDTKTDAVMLTAEVNW
jgi:hypothetical protein